MASLVLNNWAQFIQKLNLDGWNYLWLELIFLVPALFERLKFNCTFNFFSYVFLETNARAGNQILLQPILVSNTMMILNIGSGVPEKTVY